MCVCTISIQSPCYQKSILTVVNKQRPENKVQSKEKRTNEQTNNRTIKQKQKQTSKQANKQTSKQANKQTKMEALIVRYTPVLALFPNEQQYPISMETYLSNADIAMYDDSNDKFVKILKQGPLTQQSLFEFAQTVESWTGLSLKQRNDRLHITHRTDDQTPVYVNYYVQNNKLYVNYAFMFGYDEGKLGLFHACSHECDIEHATFEFLIDAPDTQSAPLRVYLCAHGYAEGTWFNFEDVQTKIVDDIERPVVYCSKGSHGFYGQPGKMTYVRLGGFANDYTSDEGVYVNAVPVLLDGQEDLVIPLPPADFNGLHPFAGSIIGDRRCLAWKSSMGDAMKVSMFCMQGWWNSITSSTGLNAAKGVSTIACNYTDKFAAFVHSLKLIKQL